MKKIILSIICVAIATNIFATHYHQEGKIGEQTSSYTVTTNKMEVTEQEDFKGFYDFTSDLAGLKGTQSDLVKMNQNIYISETGKEHNIAEMFATYERRARSMGDKIDFQSRHDVDVVCVVKRSGDTFTIDIYTGAEAKKILPQPEK